MNGICSIWGSDPDPDLDPLSWKQIHIKMKRIWNTEEKKKGCKQNAESVEVLSYGLDLR